MQLLKRDIPGSTGYCLNVGEYCPKQSVMLQEILSAINILRETIFINVRTRSHSFYSRTSK